MPESIQHKLDRVRPPRVQITYDLELGGAVERKSLPLVVGIMADLSGRRDQESQRPLAALKKRKFVEVDRDNINDIMAKTAPEVTVVPGEGKPAVTLKFSSMEDFEPLRIVAQVADLQQLFEERQQLVDLLIKLDGNDALETALLDADEARLNELKALPSGDAPAPEA
jgi:type VI secretion system protein ImpB